MAHERRECAVTWVYTPVKVGKRRANCRGEVGNEVRRVARGDMAARATCGCASSTAQAGVGTHGREAELDGEPMYTDRHVGETVRRQLQGEERNADSGLRDAN